MANLCHHFEAAQRLVEQLAELVGERLMEAPADLAQLLEQEQEAAKVRLQVRANLLVVDLNLEQVLRLVGCRINLHDRGFLILTLLCFEVV